MEFPLILTKDQTTSLKYEVVPTSLKIFVTRFMRRGRAVESDIPDIYWQNDVVNRARTLAELPIYVLESDHMGEYEAQEHAWHRSEFELCLRRLNSIEFVEFLGECIEDKWLRLEEVNAWLAAANMSVEFYWESNSSGPLAVVVHPVAGLDAELEEHPRPNVRTLIARLDRELEARDFSAVLHCSATVFETVAKDVVGIPSIAEQTLGGFFDRYRKDSSLPESILDFILDVYQRRNTVPLAGHGHLAEPEISHKEAELLVALTKAFVTFETRMSQRVD